jgi:hypothetical protein
MSTKAYITAIELANELGLPLAWLKAEAKAGRIPSLQVGRRQVFDAGTVLAALAERTAKGQDAQEVHRE